MKTRIMSVLFSFITLSLPTFAHPFKLSEALHLVDDDKPIFTRSITNIVKVEGNYFLLEMAADGIVHQFDQQGKHLRRLGDGLFNKRPKMVSEIIAFDENLVAVCNRREVFLFDLSGEQVEKFSLVEYQSDAVLLYEPRKMLVAGFDPYQYTDDWHYILDMNTKEKSFFGERHGDIYKIRNQNRYKKNTVNWNNPRVIKVGDTFWFTTSYDSSIFVYNAKGDIIKRMFSPLHNAVLIEDLTEDFVLKHNRDYMTYFTHNVNLYYDGSYVYHELFTPDSGVKMLIYNSNGALVQKLLSWNDSFPNIRGAQDGKLYAAIQTYDLEPDEALAPGVQALLPMVSNPEDLRKDGLWLGIYTFQPPAKETQP